MNEEIIKIYLNEEEQDKIQRLIYSIMIERKLLLPEEESFFLDDEYFKMLSGIGEFIKVCHNLALKNNEEA